MKRTYDELNNHSSSQSHQQQRIQHSQSPRPAQQQPPHAAAASESPSASISTPTDQQQQLTSLPAIASLKATLGNLPRVPQISRKVRACSACKKQKIRCDFDADAGENGKCVRCRKMKLECVVNRSLQTILDEDVEWKVKMTEELSQLQRAVEDILKTKHMRPLSAYTSPTHSAASSCSPGMSMATLFSGNSPTDQRILPTSVDGSPKNSRPQSSKFYEQHYSALNSASLSTNPMGSLYEVTKLRSLRSNSTAAANGPGEDDLITRGLVSLEEAEELFDLFRSTLNHYLFDVALIHDNLTSVRASSSLLLASILTVSSLHRPASNSKANTPPPTRTFGVCYQHFLTLVSSSMFDFTAAQSGPQSYTRALDNVRALSIAAFWLPDLSWKLSGHAVRIATELNVHQSYRKALKATPIGSKLTEAERMRREQERKFHYERARLWYLLYVCDHHFSIAYGRPPVICYSQHEAIRDAGFERYLESDLCKEGDFRVVSQLALFVVLERIYECFAGEISEGGMVREEVLFVEQFNHELDEWRDIWCPRLRKNAFVGDYPAKGVLLHYHFAKLQLNSLALRGVTALSTSEVTSAHIIGAFGPQRTAMARLAIESATHVLTTILTVEEIRVCLIGVPLYVHTMIAFAAVFLMKVVSRWRNVPNIADLLNPAQDIWMLVAKVVEVLRDVAGG
ncbi:hypothetical protein DFH27DRAFT_477090, partial [Peziza echinospora]